MTAFNRWEYGSNFHWCIPQAPPEKSKLPEGAVLYASGREALGALLSSQIRARRWKRFFVPTYFCQEVVAYIRDIGVSVELYEDLPLWAVPDFSKMRLRPDDAVMVVNYFGLRGQLSSDVLDAVGVNLVENHTHDPWSEWAKKSDASYCIASLRKVLPIPDGAALWSPRGLPVPKAPACTQSHFRASHSKLCAMLLKHLYLRGDAIPKQLFLDLFARGEASIAAGEPSEPSPLLEPFLAAFSVKAWRKARMRNHRIFCEAVAECKTIKVLPSQEASGSCPFSVIVVFPDKRFRDSVRKKLIENSLYPAILWPMAGNDTRQLPKATVDLSERMLSIPCDGRYSPRDVRRAASILLQVVESVQSSRVSRQPVKTRLFRSQEGVLRAIPHGKGRRIS